MTGKKQQNDEFSSKTGPVILSSNCKKQVKEKKWWQNLIINPKTCEWLPVWNRMIDICLLYGYIYDPYFISFYIANDGDADENSPVN